MIAKIEHVKPFSIKIPGIYKAAKITINGHIRYKNISDGAAIYLDTFNNLLISDTPKKGFRKYKLEKTLGRGFYVNSKSTGWRGRAFLCRRGLRDIGFRNFDYIYVKVNR